MHVRNFAFSHFEFLSVPGRKFSALRFEAWGSRAIVESEPRGPQFDLHTQTLYCSSPQFAALASDIEYAKDPQIL